MAVLVLAGKPDTIDQVESMLRELIEAKGFSVGNLGQTYGNGARDYCLYMCQRAVEETESERDVYLINLVNGELTFAVGPRDEPLSL